MSHNNQYIQNPQTTHYYQQTSANKPLSSFYNPITNQFQAFPPQNSSLPTNSFSPSTNNNKQLIKPIRHDSKSSQNKVSDSTNTKLVLPPQTDPYNYLQNHDTVPIYVMQQLIDLSKGKLRDMCWQNEGLHYFHKIGTHLFIKGIRTQIYRKIRRTHFHDWCAWIPKQNQSFTNSWKRMRLSQFDFSWQNTFNVAPEIIAFINAVKYLYPNSAAHSHTNDTSHTTDCHRECGRCGRDKHSYNIKHCHVSDEIQVCFRCGYPNHSKIQCRSTRDRNGKVLPPNKQNRNECDRCGRTSHKTYECKAKTGIKNSVKRFNDPHSCFRCGKTGHTIDECNARRDINGKRLPKPTYVFKPCDRCGRTNHLRRECHAKKTVNGKPITGVRTYKRNTAKKVKNSLLRSRKRKSNETQSQSLVCFRCGRIGNHNHNDCRAVKDVNGQFIDGINGEPSFKKQKREISAESVKSEPNVSKEQSMDSDNDDIEAGIESERVRMKCSYCNIDLKGRDVWRCGKCKEAFYCGKECQLNDWKRHKMECGKENNIKTERVCVADWNCYAIIFWLNRVNDCMFKTDIKYMDLKKHIIIGKLNGNDLLSIDNVVLRMMGIGDIKEREIILSLISDLVMNDSFDNYIANMIKKDTIIPLQYLECTQFELMDNPIKVKQSGFVYNKAFITKYIKQNKCDPITQQNTDICDLIECRELNLEIQSWKQNHFVF